jgi:hypothetical protein
MASDNEHSSDHSLTPDITKEREVVNFDHGWLMLLSHPSQRVGGGVFWQQHRGHIVKEAACFARSSDWLWHVSS